MSIIPLPGGAHEEKRTKRTCCCSATVLARGRYSKPSVPLWANPDRWLYKWIARYAPDDPAWCESRSRKPLISPHRTPAEIEDIVEMVRLSLYNKELFCGDQAIRWELEDMNVQPLPSLSTIGRILRRRDLTHRRTGRYEPKGKAYPALAIALTQSDPSG